MSSALIFLPRHLPAGQHGAGGEGDAAALCRGSALAKGLGSIFVWGMGTSPGKQGA